MKTYINTLDYKEFAEIVDSHDELKNKAYEWATETAWEFVQYDYLRKIPQGVKWGIDAWDNIYISIPPYYIGRDTVRDIIRYFEQLRHEYCVFGQGEEFDATIEKMTRYNEVLSDDDYSVINMKDKDYNYCVKFLNSNIEKFFDEIITICNDEIEYARTRFIEEAWESDWFDDYYLDDNGDLYERRIDRKIA